MLDQPAGRGTILLVEDEPFVALLAQQVLEDHGFTVLVAGHGRTAIEQVEVAREPLALAVVDLGLPDIGGDEVVRALRRLRPTLPVVIATGYATDEIEAEFTLADGVAVIRKPYDVRTLRTTLRRLGLDMPED
ncbi:response regulator [Xanthobacter sp. V4C-4]|uniref:response regulator n=1 Tax=Xanthobacter cornucopiae TaxID=3119924 RepID=UPI00372CBE41